MPAAVGSGFAVAIWGLREVPSFPPANADGWLFFIAVAALVLSPLWSALKSPGSAFVVSVLWGLAVSYSAVWPLVHSGAYTLIEGVKQMTWSTFGVTAFVLFLLRADSASGRGITLLSELMLAGALMILLIVSASAFLGLLAGTCAVALAALLVLWWFRRDLEVTPPAAATLGILLSGCLLHGYYYAYLPFESAVLFIAAAALLALPIQEFARKAYIVRLTGVALFLALSIGLAAADYFELVYGFRDSLLITKHEADRLQLDFFPHAADNVRVDYEIKLELKAERDTPRRRRAEIHLHVS